MGTVTTTVLSTLTGLVLGYFITYFKSFKLIKQSLLYLLQNSLTNVFFVYEKIGQIPDYVYKNWKNMYKIYRALDGNDYMLAINEKMDNLEIVKTDIIKYQGEK